MDKALWEVIFNIREKKPETLLPELQRVLGTRAISDYPTLGVLVEHALYYYQFTNLPNPLERGDLAARYGYAYKLADFEGEGEKLAFCRELVTYLNHRELSDASFNHALGCVAYVGERVTGALGPEFEAYRLEQRMLVLLAFRLVGRENFMRVYEQTYTRLQRKYFDRLYWTTFVQVVRLAFEGCRYRRVHFRRLNTSSQRATHVPLPEDLDRVLRRAFGPLYLPAPLPFLFSTLLHTNADDIFAARRALDAIERARRDAIVPIHQPAFFNVFGAGFLPAPAVRRQRTKRPATRPRDEPPPPLPRWVPSRPRKAAARRLELSSDTDEAPPPQVEASRSSASSSPTPLSPRAAPDGAVPAEEPAAEAGAPGELPSAEPPAAGDAGDAAGPAAEGLGATEGQGGQEAGLPADAQAAAAEAQ